MKVMQTEYKDTKIGKIPKDWEVIKLGETCEFYRGQPFAKSEIDNNGDHECIHYGELFTVYSEIIRKIYSKTNSEVVRASKFGDVLMPSSDVTPIGLATASVINKNGVLIGGDVNIIRPILKLNSDYLSYLINHEKKKIIRLISGTNVKHIYNRNIKTLLYALPPLPEQQKIAEILSTVDGQISTTQAIIEKSKELKKGLMQKLFSEGIGHTEFKDTKIGRIPKDWEVVKVGDICKLQGGFAFKSADASESGVRWFKIANVGINRVKWNDESFLPNGFEEKHSDFVLNEGDIVVAMTRPVLSGQLKICRILKNDSGSLLNQRVGRVVLKDNDDSIYFYQCFNTKHFIDSVEGELFGTDPPNISSKIFENIKILLPPKQERGKIADILIEADAKIEKEEQEKAQLEQLKKGLMQQLLTGQKRVA